MNAISKGIISAAGLAALVVTLLFVSPSTAHARRGIALINTGEDFFPTGPLPAPFASEASLAGYQSGYMCSIAGVFWIYLYTWDCKPVAFREDTYVDPPELVAAIKSKYSESDKQMGFWKGGMRWVLLGLAVLMGALALFGGKGDEEPAAAPPAPDDQT